MSRLRTRFGYKVNKKSFYIFFIGVPLAIIYSVSVVAFAYNKIAVNDHSFHTQKADAADATKKQPESTSSPVANDKSGTASTSASSSTRTSPAAFQMPDSDGCTPGTSGYQACRDAAARLAFMNQCYADERAANNAFYAAYNSINATYNADIASKQQEVNMAVSQYGYTSGWAASVMVAYRHERTQQYNADISPSYVSYVAAFSALNSRGCNLSQLYRDPSLPF